MSDRVKLEVGMQAPGFSLQDQHGDTRTLTELHGRRVILFAYPAAMTPGCSTEAREFQQASSALHTLGVSVLGLSPDSIEKLARFAERDGIDYPLLSDVKHRVLAAYGAYGEKKNYGRSSLGVIRSTFIIDAAGRIEHTLYNVKATGHVARVRKLLGVE